MRFVYFSRTVTFCVFESSISPCSGIFVTRSIFGVTLPSLETSTDQWTNRTQLQTDSQRSSEVDDTEITDQSQDEWVYPGSSGWFRVMTSDLQPPGRETTDGYFSCRDTHTERYTQKYFSQFEHAQCGRGTWSHRSWSVEEEAELSCNFIKSHGDTAWTCTTILSII